MIDAAPARLRQALYPLDTPPRDPGWNADELAGLLPDGLGTTEAAVLVGLVPRGHGLSVVLTRRNDGLRQHAGQVSFPGGRIDPGDLGAVDAALRETREEIGIGIGDIEPWGFLDPLATITGYRILPVVARIDPACVAVPDAREVAEVFEMPLDYLMDHANLSARRVQLGGRERVVWEYLYPGQRIWGATASILLNLRTRLEASA